MSRSVLCDEHKCKSRMHFQFAIVSAALGDSLIELIELPTRQELRVMLKRFVKRYLDSAFPTVHLITKTHAAPCTALCRALDDIEERKCY